MGAKRNFTRSMQLGVVAALMASTAHAGGFALREQSAFGQGSSFAGVAAGGSLSTMFWNPATLSQIMGFEVEAVGTGIFPTSDVTIDGVVGNPLFPGSDEGDIAQDAFLPALYAGYRLNDRLVLGLAVNSPYGLVTEYSDDSILRGFGIAGEAEVFSMAVNPSISYQLTDWLALAIGAQVQYIDVRYTNLGLGDPPDGPGLSSVEGDDVTIGATAGLLLTPWAGTEIGLGYRSRIEHELEGELETTFAGNFDVTGDGLDLPDIVTLGIRQRITDDFRIMAGVEWSNWSIFETVTLTGAPADIPLEFEYDDGWFFSLGGEYDLNEKLTLRAGIGYELSPLDDANRNFRLPDNDRLWLSAGLSYKPTERLSLDLAYSYLSVEDTDILAGESFGGEGPDANGPFFGEAESDVHLISAGLKYRFGGPAKSMAGEPIVVKP